ncbi:MAG: Gfo/Idh/MocA family oxidoreductase [Candidatus Omnitrophica bacterium]|nr:Gfo/Idh/MocA family oxidoreductase [Candidatus Omnitrophota bacterium]
MKFLIVGCGSIGRRHASNLLKLKVGEVIVCDTDPARLEEIKKEHGLRGFASLEEALREKPEAALICTPTHLHVPAALECLKAGCHLFIEKPVATSLEEARRLIPAARNRVVLTACNMRFHPGVIALHQNQKLLRHPVLYRARFSHFLPNWRPETPYQNTQSAMTEQSGGIILECIHEIDYLRWLAGPIKGVRALIKYGVHNQDETLKDIKTADYAVVLVDFQSGATGEIRLDYLQHPKERGCEIVSPGDGSLYWGSKNKRPEEVVVFHISKDGLPKPLLPPDDSYDPNDMYINEMRHFVDCLERRAEPLVGLDEAIETLQWALEAARYEIPEAKGYVGASILK